MKRFIIYIYKCTKYGFDFVITQYGTLYSYLLFYVNGVNYSSLKSFGVPYVNVSRGGSCFIGEKFVVRNGYKYSVTGDNRPTKIIVARGGRLVIGKNVGITSSAIVAWNSIIIGDNVRIGGGCQIFDTDFHSLNFKLRLSDTDFLATRTQPVCISDNVFIGAHSLILKGVTIGENSIIGAGSVVTHDIPSNQIWAGNPAKYIREIIDE
ncbi:acyltransferase [Bacteroides fragilis]|jgi:transferase hexapeptide repeat containing protein|nr:acyltransferase [Bacteroides fragilis]